MSFTELLEKGRRCLDDGDDQQALQALQQAVKLEQSAEAWQLLAEAELNLGQIGKAEKSISNGLKLESNRIELLYMQGDLFAEQGKGEAAIKIFNQIFALDGYETDALVSKAMLLFDGEDLHAAEALCRQALEIEPTSVFALNTLGDILFAAGDQEGAAGAYQQAIEVDPEEAQAHLSLAEIYYDQGDLEQAEAACLKGLELDAGLPMGYLTLGYVYLDQDRNQESIENFQQFLRLEKSPAAKQIRDEVAAVIDGLK